MAREITREGLLRLLSGFGTLSFIGSQAQPPSFEDTESRDLQLRTPPDVDKGEHSLDGRSNPASRLPKEVQESKRRKELKEQLEDLSLRTQVFLQKRLDLDESIQLLRYGRRKVPGSMTSGIARAPCDMEIYNHTANDDEKEEHEALCKMITAYFAFKEGRQTLLQDSITYRNEAPGPDCPSDRHLRAQKSYMTKRLRLEDLKRCAVASGALGRFLDIQVLPEGYVQAIAEEEQALMELAICQKNLKLNRNIEDLLSDLSDVAKSWEGKFKKLAMHQRFFRIWGDEHPQEDYSAFEEGLFG